MEGANKCILNHVRRHCGTLIVNAGFPRTVMAVTQGTALKTVCYGNDVLRDKVHMCKIINRY